MAPTHNTMSTDSRPAASTIGPKRACSLTASTPAMRLSSDNSSKCPD